MIDEIKQALAAATQGPWESKTNRHPELNGNDWGWISSKGGQIGTWSGSRNENYRNDNHLIANAPEWLRCLIQENARYREALEWYAGRFGDDADIALKALEVSL